MFKLKRKKQSKKIPLSKKDVSNILFSGKGLAFFIILGVSIGIAIFTYDYLSRSDYFDIETVEIRGTNLTPQLLSKRVFEMGKGENIFSADIFSIHKHLTEDYPEIQELKVIKVFPNKLMFRIKARKPIAQLLYYNKLYPVDIDRVILPNISTIAQKDLPIISGINYRIDRNIGKECRSKQLDNAFLLIEAMKNSNFLAEHDLSMIDASDIKNLSFYIEDGIEVKIGSENFPERLNLLKKAFLDPNMNKSQIKYLDLRFEGVTIGPKAIK